MLVLGIDPGTAVTGYGLVRRDQNSKTGPAGIGMRLVECGVIRTKPRDPLAARLREIHFACEPLFQGGHRAAHILD